MVGPLVQHGGGEFLHPVADGILRDHHGPAFADQLVDAVVDFPVQVIGPPGKNDHGKVLFLGKGQKLPALLADPLHVCLVFPIGRIGSRFDLLLRNGREIFCQDLLHFSGEIFPSVQAHIVVNKFRFAQGLDIGVQYLGIIGHHRAVIVVIALVLIEIIAHAGVKNGVRLSLQQGLDVAMDQLCRVAYRIGGNGMLAPEIQLPVGIRGMEHPEAQLRKESVPEGVQLKHVEPHGDPDGPPLSLTGSVRVQKLPLIIIQVILCGLAVLLQGLVAAVSGNVPGGAAFPRAEGIHRQAAVVLAAVAGNGPYLVGKGGKTPLV